MTRFRKSFIATYINSNLNWRKDKWDLDDCIIIILHTQTNYDYDTNSDKFSKAFILS